MDIADDLDALAELGWGPDAIDKLASSGMPGGAFATFRALEPETRDLVIRLLDGPTDRDFEELHQHPAGKSIANWLLTLPAYANAPEDDDE
jgi:hypothetical protein